MNGTFFIFHRNNIIFIFHEKNIICIFPENNIISIFYGNNDVFILFQNCASLFSCNGAIVHLDMKYWTKIGKISMWHNFVIS